MNLLPMTPNELRLHPSSTEPTKPSKGMLAEAAPSGRRAAGTASAWRKTLLHLLPSPEPVIHSDGPEIHCFAAASWSGAAEVHLSPLALGGWRPLAKHESVQQA